MVAAVRAYREGVPYEFNAGEIAQIAEYIQEFGDPDPWMDKISQYVMIRQEVTARRSLTCTGLDPGNRVVVNLGV